MTAATMFKLITVPLYAVLIVIIPLATIAACGWSGWRATGSVWFALAFGLLDLIKVTLPSLLRAGWAARRRLVTVAGGIIMVCLAVWSGIATQSLINGLLAERVMPSVNAVTAATERIALSQRRTTDLKAELKRIDDHLKIDGWSRPAAQVQADVASHMRNHLWELTDKCSKDVTGQRRVFCAAFDRLTGELAAASRADKLRERQAHVQSQILETPPTPVSHGVEVENLALVAWLFGVDQTRPDWPLHAAWWAALAAAVLIEVAAITVPILALDALAQLRGTSQVGGPAVAKSSRSRPNSPKPQGTATGPRRRGGRGGSAMTITEFGGRPPRARTPGRPWRLIDGGSGSSPAVTTSPPGIITEPVGAIITRTNLEPSARASVRIAEAEQPPSPGEDAGRVPSSFIAARVIVTKETSLSAAQILTAFQAWCLAHGHRPPAQKALGQAMTAAGFERWISHGVVRYRNVALKE